MNPQEASTPSLALADQVEEARAGSWRVLSAPTPVGGVVSFRGSFCTFPDFASGESVLQDLLVYLLDKGTRSASVIALTEIDALVLDPREFKSLLLNVPAIAVKVATALAARVRELDTKLYG